MFSIPSRFIKELPEKNISITNLFFETSSNKGMTDPNYTSTMGKNILKIDNVLLIGDKVFHQKFGYGIIKTIEGNNAEVAFSKTNLKKVKIEYLTKNV